MASIMIGSFNISLVSGQEVQKELSSSANCSLAVRGLSVKPEQMASSLTPVKNVAFAHKFASSQLLKEYDAKMKAFDLSFANNETVQHRLFLQKYSALRTVKKGTIRYKYCSFEQALQRQEKEEKDRKETENFLAGLYEERDYAGRTQEKFSTSCGEQISFKTSFYRRTCKKPVVHEKKKKQCTLDSALHQILHVAKQQQLPLEFITSSARKTLKARYVRKHGCILPKIHLPHEDGLRLPVELDYSKHQDVFERLCSIAKYVHIPEGVIQKGDSGLIFGKNSQITKAYTELPYFVVRGRLNGKLVNAIEICDEYHMVEQYTQTPEVQFFTGWRRVFDKMVPHTMEHECTIDYNNEQCGEIAAGICQTLYPVKKLSCAKCRAHLKNLSWEEYKQFVATHMSCCELVVPTQSEETGLVLTRTLIKQATIENMHLDLSLEIVRLTQNHTSTAMLQIQDINKALMKGTTATQQDLKQATKQLLAMTQWWKNHMNLTNEDALKSFRNKRSSKALINPNLLCDNQLDRNGNFVWGERGRHSKRFFSNFFDEVVPSEGYQKYVIRRNPNGQRKLAINSLVVPLDLARARIALQGESIHRQPITMACVSIQDNNFVYPCCCVTLDDGRPLYSELKSPTKRHLVVGASGDPKYIDLPATDADRMYIAKEGYCYLNIFLAMLVNVNEDDAKDFTKMVRDVIVPKLGTWPSMMDVATAVYMLTVFHPETRSAELPRILVDHETQTMHVIDSFGSYTVGYHVLKAGTVNQLIQFASNDLKSDLKHYKVGGDVQQRIACEKALITSIFKPRRMIQILENDPYILLMGLVSPTLLIHMYRLRHFEKGIEMWIRKEQSVGRIFLVMEQLTKKLVLNDVLLEQLGMISQTSSKILQLLEDCPKHMHSHRIVRDAVQVISETSTANLELNANGYTDINVSLYNELEKIFTNQLKQEWHALSWLEKFSVTWHLKRFSTHTEKHLIERATEGSKEFSEKFVSVCFTTAQTHLRSSRTMFCNKFDSLWRSITRGFIKCILNLFNKCYSDIIFLVNVSIVLSLLIQISSTMVTIVHNIRKDKEHLAILQCEKDEATIMRIYEMYMKKSEGSNNAYDFVQHVEIVRPDLKPLAMTMISDEETVSIQGKTKVQMQLERIIAFMALITMFIDSERSDAVFNVLHKVKAVFGTLGEEVKVQSLDDVLDIEDAKNLTVDFELATSSTSTSTTFDVTFEDWWNKQLQQNRVVPHYRTTGSFMEFTRETAANVANQIVISSSVEFIVRGAVGSGKSTGLPHHLSKRGRVLLLEPTRPLAENVSKQLGKDPFYHTVTLRMRGLSRFGSSNITVMTSGFAFHYYAHNPQQLNDFDYIIIDECHVLDSSTIAFNCALKEYEYSGKLVKVSATPPGRECEFTTQYPVKLKMEEQLSFSNFAQAQGTHSNADMTQHGHNLLVYVASYNEVDQLSKCLLDRHFRVTKVDGRTMQMGNVEIETKGTESKPHFIVATNIIENGVTLDIDCVIDFGLKVVAVLDTDNRCIRYEKKSINYGERLQRLGRVGRHKPGFALRIGHTEKGLEEIPEYIATEAAFLSFAFGLPVTTQGVSTNNLSKCTVKQAKSALNFELTPFFTIHFVRYDGSIHPEVHRLLKPYKLRESEMILNKLAIPNRYTNQWMTVKEYGRIGVVIQSDENARLPFYVHGIPDKLFETLWDTVCKYKHDAGFGKISSVNATKISYTLSTDPTALPRTIAIIDHLISEELTKRNHFDTISSSITGHSFTLAGIVDGIRKRYLQDHTQHNINILQQAKSQLLEFNNSHVDINQLANHEDLGVLNTVRLQSGSEIGKFLGLKGKWDKKKFTNDAIVAVFSLIGGGWMLWDYFSTSMKEPVITQGKKRMMQKLKFRDAFDRKIGREVYADDNTMEHTFGEAYTKKGKQKGSMKTKGMGRKTRNFVHMYGVEPENYSMIRFVDPLTGFTMDENTRVDIRLVQEEVGEMRKRKIEEGELDRQLIMKRPGIQAYLMGKATEEAVKIDLNPHRPTLLCMNSNAIAGFPEREDELRQTGLPQKIPMSEVPAQNEMVDVESKSVYKGLRDYNGIATLICRIENISDGHVESIYGIGYGSYIITNGHLFRRNNGKLTVKTWHGDFTINNSTQLKIFVFDSKDAILIRMPKDFPPFSKKCLFRSPRKEERACLIGTNFQEKSLRATVSESSMITSEGKGSFWIHWITTKDGDCGLPLVSVEDGHILGIHGLTSNETSKNFFVPFTDTLKEQYLDTAESLNWHRHWLWQPEKIAWGSLNLVENQPKSEFKVAKLIHDLFENGVKMQSKNDQWVLDAAEGNLVACGTGESALVTKHVVKGKCHYFAQYLNEVEDAATFFKPLMGAYQPSKLNKEAFKKDFFKYNKAVALNEVVYEDFEQAVDGVKLMMLEYNFSECLYVTDPDDIIDSLNMKAAVGAQYKGKKQDYFSDLDTFDKERLLFQSCERLFYGDKGVWNGSLKAELRPLEKVMANKTRTFTAAPIDTLLGAKACVDDFNNQFYDLNLTCPWSVGMTKFYGGWDKLMRALPNGWIYCHADGSQFDSSLTPLLLNAVLDVRLFFMEDWWVGAEMLRNLYAEIVYTPIMTPDGTVFKKFRGNNSGQPSTVVDNTLMVVIAMYYACIKQKWTYDDIQERLVFFANGDDIILAVQENDEWLLDTLTQSFSELGLNYDFSERSKERTDLWFMSHRAILVDGMYIPKLEPERIVSILEWDRSKELMHRTEAICASMIEAWGYGDLLREIRKFYLWLLEKPEFKELAANGKTPYIAETALKKLYTDKDANVHEIQEYLRVIDFEQFEDSMESVSLQSGKKDEEIDAGKDKEKSKEQKNTEQPGRVTSTTPTSIKERDVGASSSGKVVPRLRKITQRMNLPTVGERVILDLDHLIEYKPSQTDLFNTRATKSQFAAWYDKVKQEYELDDNQMGVVMNGFMVWCIDNGTSPDVNGVWVMMDGQEQVEYPLKPIVENAKPTLRQIMHHFSDAAEAYIEMRNSEEFYMPRYGLLRNLRDKSLARYAFDFYEVNSKTSERAREAVAQMKAAALANVNTRMFGLDGNVATTSENTERHTARDVNQNMHTLLGMGPVQ
nr:polyprotein [Ugandan passiflora virus]